MTVTAASPPRQARRRAAATTDPRVERARGLLAEPIDFMDHPLFDKPEAEAVVLDPATEVPRANVAWYSQIAVDGLSSQTDPAVRPTNLPLLNAEQERHLFLRYNYTRYRAELVRRQIVAAKRLSAGRVRDLLHWYDTSRALREQIAEYNLALVLAMVQRLPSTQADFQDLISEGNLALLRAIDKFDVGRGFKFSTYACRAMIKAFGRLGIKATKHKSRFPVEFDPEFERSNHQELKAAEHERECAAHVKELFVRNTAKLTAVERQVIGHRFAIGPYAEEAPLTLDQVGKMVGLTKERVRQIQKAAMSKLRDSLEATFLSKSPQTDSPMSVTLSSP